MTTEDHAPMAPSPTQDELRGQLAHKLACASKQLNEQGGVTKDGRNDHHRYDYATIDGVLSAVAPVIAHHGIATIPAIEKIDRAANGKSQHVTLYLQISIVDTETGYGITVPWVAEAQDSQDKAITKAISYGMKMFLLRLLHIPAGEDNDSHPATGTTPYATPAPAPPPAPKPGYITSDQRRELWALWGNKHDVDGYAAVLRDVAGVASSADIRDTQYDLVAAAVTGAKKDPLAVQAEIPVEADHTTPAAPSHIDPDQR